MHPLVCRTLDELELRSPTHGLRTPAGGAPAADPMSCALRCLCAFCHVSHARQPTVAQSRICRPSAPVTHSVYQRAEDVAAWNDQSIIITSPSPHGPMIRRVFRRMPCAMGRRTVIVRLNSQRKATGHIP
jgi:hypothetical protein